jgi:hypothetical protein
MSICSLLSSTALIMRDGERKVLTAGNMFYNTLSAWQALHRYRRWSCHRSSTPTLVLASLLRLLRRRRYPDVVSETNLLHLPVTNLHCIDIHRGHQADRSTTIPNTLRGMWGRSNCHPISGIKELHLADCFCPCYWRGLICTWKFTRI